MAPNQDLKVQAVLLGLLRSELWERGDAAALCPLTAAEWNRLFRYAQKHTIEGVVFGGLQRMPENLLPPRELLLKWTVRIDQVERRNRHISDAMKVQLQHFAAAGIQPVLLKGIGAAACYPIPAHRISGDVDWYFESAADFKQANALMGRRIQYCWQGIVVEHHQRMFDIHNPCCLAYLNRLQRQFRAEQLEFDLQGSPLKLPAPILMMVQVNTHILKHLLSFGIGIRQLCDAARIYHTYKSMVSGQELKAIFRRLGILRWIDLLHAVLVRFIGLPQTDLPFPLPAGIAADWMMEDIWLAGNFGLQDARFESQPATDGRRRQAGQRVGANLRKYFRYAPMEALSFPVVQLISGFAHRKP